MIILIFLSCIIFLLSFFKSSNKYCIIAMLILLWVLFAFSYKTADYNIYYRRYYFNYIESTELLFNIVVRISNKLGLSLETFIAFVASLYILSIGILLLNKKKKIAFAGFALCLYFVYPFCMDVTQLRSTMSFLPIIIGFHFLFVDSDGGKTTNDTKFIFCVLISTLIHFSGIFYLILLICKKISIKQATILTILFLFVSSTYNVVSEFIYYIAGKAGAENKILTVLNNINMQVDETVAGTKKMMILTFILVMLIMIHIYKRDRSKYFEYIIKMNIVIMITLPLLDYAVDLFRIQRYLLLFTYIAFALHIKPDSEQFEKYSVRMLLFKIVCMTVPLTGFYVNIMRSNIFSNVVFPIFYNNVMFSIFS